MGEKNVHKKGRIQIEALRPPLIVAFKGFTSERFL